jgi:hypothetical protein
MKEYYQHKNKPYKVPQDRKRNSIQVKYPDAEYDAIAKRARQLDMPLGVYIRHCMRDIVSKLMKGY